MQVLADGNPQSVCNIHETLASFRDLQSSINGVKQRVRPLEIISSLLQSASITQKLHPVTLPLVILHLEATLVRQPLLLVSSHVLHFPYEVQI